MKVKEAYRKLDNKIRKLSRTEYALLIGLTSATAALLTSTAFGRPDLVFSIGIGLALTVLNYVMDPNKEKEE